MKEQLRGQSLVSLTLASKRDPRDPGLKNLFERGVLAFGSSQAAGDQTSVDTGRVSSSGVQVTVVQGVQRGTCGDNTHCPAPARSPRTVAGSS